MRPPSFICSNPSLRRDEQAAGIDVDHAASSCSKVVDEHVKHTQSACLVDGDLDTARRWR
jgi:hypothetical protein